MSKETGGGGLGFLRLTPQHVFMAVVNPATRPALPGMVFGRMRRSWAARHHRAWLHRVAPR